MGWLDFFVKVLPAVSKLLLGVAALITAWKGRKTAKEVVNDKQKD
jgi:hypothetical protein